MPDETTPAADAVETTPAPARTIGLLRLRGKVSTKANPVPPRKFVFAETNGPHLELTLQYFSPAAEREQINRAQAKVMESSGRGDRLVNGDSQSNLIREALHLFTAECVLNVTRPEGLPLRLRDIDFYLPIDREAMIAEYGPDVADQEMSFDTADKDPAMLEGKQLTGYEGRKLTKGDLAYEHVLMLVRHNPALADWVRKVSVDLANFRDADWGEQAKN